MQKRGFGIISMLQKYKKATDFRLIHEFLESPSDKLQIRTTLGRSLELVHLSGFGPRTIFLNFLEGMMT